MIPHDFSPRFSTSTGMFLTQQPAITTDMKPQEEMVETSCHLSFHPDDQLDKHDLSMTPLLYRMRHRSDFSECCHIVRGNYLT